MDTCVKLTPYDTLLPSSLKEKWIWSVSTADGESHRKILSRTLNFHNENRKKKEKIHPLHPKEKNILLRYQNPTAKVTGLLLFGDTCSTFSPAFVHFRHSLHSERVTTRYAFVLVFRVPASYKYIDGVSQ